jgi:ABC-type phosphate/phosphonate transport system substrate-binding protein
VRDDVPDAEVQQLVALLTGLGERTEGRVALERLGFLQGFDPATDSEYREVRHER